jgi:outer membrane autotransporter protein
MRPTHTLLAVLLALATALPSFGRTFGDDVPQIMLATRGTVDAVAGALINIPGLTGSDSLTYSIVVSNDSTTDNLLVAVNVAGSTAVEIPTPDTNLATVEVVFVVLPGESLSLDLGAQNVGLRAEAGTVDCRVLATRR